MNRREFHFSEGTSNKFWAVQVDDATMTVQFGKVGSAGQTKLQTFPNNAAAVAAAEKLIKEKTGKGYTEVAGSATPAPPAPAKPATAPSPAPPAAKPQAAPERRINLAPEDWLLARWRRTPVPAPAPLPAARPFDLPALKAALIAGAGNWLEHIWDAAPPPEVVTPEEARFWFHAYVEWDNNATKRKKWIESFTAEQFARPLSTEDVIARFGRKWFDKLGLPILRMQRFWLPPADYIDVACRHSMVGSSVEVARQEADWLEANYFPRLSAKEMDAVRAALREKLKGGGPRQPETAAVIAPAAGMDADLNAYLDALKPETYSKYRFNQEASAAILGLPDAAAVQRHFRRLGLLLGTPEEVRGWLAHTEYSALDVVRDSALALHVDGLLKALDVLMLVESPEAAAALLEVKTQTKNNKAVAKVAKWLDAHPAHAVAGLTPLAEQKGKVGEAARAWLDEAGKRGLTGGESKPAKPTPPTPPPVPPTAPPAAPPAPERKLNLAPEDWQRAKAPEPEKGKLPAPRPFDVEACKAQALAYLHREDVPFDPDVPCTPQEARFWLHVSSEIQKLDGDDGRERGIRRLTAKQFDKARSLDQVKKACEEMHFWQCNQPTTRMQRWALSPADFVEALACNQVFSYYLLDAAETGRWLAAKVFPRLSEAEMASVRERFKSLLKPNPDVTTLAAATLARHADMEADLAAWAAGIKKGGIPGDLITTGWGPALFGINDGPTIIKEFRRLGLRVCSPADARLWLALTGHDGLDVLRDSILAQRKAASQLELLDVLLLAESPEAAVALLEVRLKIKPPEAVARIDAWLKKHPGHAAAGLVPLTAEGTPRGEAARSIVGSMSAASAAPPAADWLGEALAAVKPPRALPSYAEPAVLPPVHGLGGDDVSRVVAALQSSTLTGPHPLVSALRKNGDRPALAAFAWKLFDGWVNAGAPSKEKWALLSLGLFGDDTTVTKLEPLIRVWPGQSQHQRAVTGLEVLRTIGSDAALTALNGMALKLKFKALQDRARQLMDLIAADRGLTREQLEDRIVPDLGLDADGGRAFDFGPRHFRFALAADLSPAVTDEAGKQLKDLPKPGAKDDAAKAASSAEAWKQLKAQLRGTLKVQTMRLEDAMITGRSWSPEEFEALLVRHPLMGHLVRRLVWAGLGADGAPACHFRVNEAREWINHDGRAVPREGVARVRVAHRLRMTPGQVTSWRAAFDALDVEPLFPQLERDVHAPAEADAGATSFVRPAVPVPASRFRSGLEDRGWRRLMHDQGGITGFSRAYPSASVTAVVELTDTIVLGMMAEGDVGVQQAFFTPGVDLSYGSCTGEDFDHRPRVPLGQVDAVAYSETVRDLNALAPPGKG